MDETQETTILVDMGEAQIAMLQELKAVVEKYNYGYLLEIKLLRGSTTTTISR